MLTERNVGSLDRIIRLALGVLFLLLAFFVQAEQWAWILLGLIGIVGIVTGLMRHCTVYSLFGLSTVEKG
ncbi:MAG: hypothetical protein Sv326_0327 [Candidatus Fermentimicrarchaeum limneticum]|uniref:Inner membrane protein YgaP-like transmembrane domain-containing protein n=1 Tax=Fermentimicrarchaeum limneticum TaxID=2795018 RepID=A0A7D6BN93_FERL1|nr:MAG: hypothetical protein Sv326_0327 [Candidatus Fermentimicrarchaeum limneticum]